MALRTIIGTLFVGLVLSGCQTTSSAQKQTQEHTALEACFLDYGSENRTSLSIEGAKNFCTEEIQAFLRNPGYEIQPYSLSQPFWENAVGIIEWVIKPNGKKSSIAYLQYGPIVGKWWAIEKK